MGASGDKPSDHNRAQILNSKQRDDSVLDSLPTLESQSETHFISEQSQRTTPPPPPPPPPEDVRPKTTESTPHLIDTHGQTPQPTPLTQIHSRRSRNAKSVPHDTTQTIQMPKILQKQLEKQQEAQRNNLEHAAFDLSRFTEQDFPASGNPMAAHSGTANPLLASQIKHPFFDTHFHLFSFLRQFEMHRLDLLEMRQMMWTKQYWRQNAVPCICRLTDSVQLHHISWHDIFQQARYWPLYGVFGTRPEFAGFYSNVIHKRLAENVQHERCVGVGDLGLLYEVFEEDVVGEENSDDSQDVHTHHGAPPTHKVSEQVRKTQRSVLQRLLQLAVKHGRSISLRPPRTQLEFTDLMESLREHVPRDWKLHVHPLNARTHLRFVSQIQEEFSQVHFGLNAELLTLSSRPNEAYESMIRLIPLERTMLGSDSPITSTMLTNAVEYGALQVVTPAHVPLMANVLGGIHGRTATQVGLLTRENVNRVYGV